MPQFTKEEIMNPMQAMISAFQSFASFFAKGCRLIKADLSILAWGDKGVEGERVFIVYGSAEISSADLLKEFKDALDESEKERGAVGTVMKREKKPTAKPAKKKAAKRK